MSVPNSAVVISRRLAIIVLGSLSLVGSAGAQTQRASVEGTVVSATTKRPVTEATVEVTGVIGGRVVSHTARTAKDGTFRVRDIEPGEGYALIVLNGTLYLPAQYGQARPLGPGTPLKLTSGAALKDVRIELTPTGSITGRVVDQLSKPLRNIFVNLLPPRYDHGDWLPVSGSSVGVRTDSQGEYRLSGLQPGQYYIQARKADQDLAPTFFPGAVDPGYAKAVDLDFGADIRVQDLIFQELERRQVTGTVVDSNGSPVANARVVLVSVHAASMLPNGKSDREGTFILRNVVPGTYVLTASAGENPSVRVGSIPLTVAVTDLEKVRIPIGPAFTLGARIVMEDEPIAGLKGFSLALQPVQSQFLTVTSTPATDGRAMIRGLGPWEYRVTLSPLPRDVYVKSVRLGAADVMEDGLELTPENASQELQIVLSSEVGEIDGVALDRLKQPVPYARIVLVPNGSRRVQSDFYRAGIANALGEFQIQGLPPGDYTVFSWERAPESAWLNSEFLRLYENRGTPVQLKAGRREDVDVAVLPPWPNGR